MGNVSMLKFKNFITEGASLTTGQILNPDRAFRLELFLRKYIGNEPFELKDGGTVVLKYNEAVAKALKSGNGKEANRIGLETANGEKISFGKLLKSKEFGGGTSGSGGGASQTRAVESAQCVYLQAIWDNPQTKFTPEEIANSFAKCHTDATLEEVLGITDDWVNSSMSVAKALYRNLGKKRYSFHRGSDWVNSITGKTGVWSVLNRQEKLFQDANKWNPADIWIVAEGAEGKYDLQNAESIAQLNQGLLKAWEARDIIGVSLKLAGSKPRIQIVNYKKPFKAPVFQSVSYNKRGDFFKSKDGYLFGRGGIEVQFRTFPTFQAEVIGKKAKHGKLSHGGIESILKDVTGGSLDPRKQLESEIRSKTSVFLDRFHAMYSSAVSDPVDRQEFEKKLQGKDTNWLVSKYYVTSIFSQIKGREQEFLSRIYQIAKSQTKESSIHLKVS